MKNRKSNVFIMIILALLILSPLDLLPDFIPVIGWLDDILYAVGIVTGVLKMIQEKRTEPEVVIDAQQWDNNRK